MLASPEDDFDCVICGHHVCMRWNRVGCDQTIAPICRYCEGEYGGTKTNQPGGSLRDRREVRRGLALSEALHCEAARQQWGGTYATA